MLDRWVAADQAHLDGDWWSAYAIIVFFQLVTNGWLTGRGIVRYDPDTILGSGRVVLVGDWRLVYAPVEDLAFGFGLVLVSCVAWTWLGRRDPEVDGMSVAARLEAMQPTDIGVPGPTSMDMARAFRSVRRDPLTFLGEVQRQYGDLVSFPVPGPPALLLNDPDDIRHVLQTSARHWGKRTVQYAALGRVTGPGLLASAEPSWIEHRRLAAPAFHHERLAAVSDRVRRGRRRRHPCRAADRPAVRTGHRRRGRPDAPHRAGRRRPGPLLRRPRRSRPGAAPRQQPGRRAGRPPGPLGAADRRVDPDADQPPAAVGPTPPRRGHRRS